MMWYVYLLQAHTDLNEEKETVAEDLDGKCSVF